MVGSEVEKRKWRRRHVNFLVKVIFPTRGVKEVHEATLRLHDISEGGASILSQGLQLIPDFFYMQFDEDDNSKMVGCYVVERAGSKVRCQFWSEMASKDLEDIIALKERAAAFENLFTSGNDTVEETSTAFDELFSPETLEETAAPSDVLFDSETPTLKNKLLSLFRSPP